jgi:hypothetical protein
MNAGNVLPDLPSRRRFLRGLAGLALTGPGLLAGCGNAASPPRPTQAPTPTPSPQIRIGLLAPLQGPNEPFGRAARYGAQRAINRIGGQRRYQLVAADIGGSPAEQTIAARKLVDEDQVVAAMIGIGSPTPRVPAEVFQAARVPVVGWACMLELVDLLGPQSFVFINRETFEFFCPQQPSTGGAAVFAEDTMAWILRAITAADPWAIAADPRAIRDALARLPYR